MAEPASIPEISTVPEFEDACCGVCASERRVPLLRKRGFTYCECADCGHVFVSPRWTRAAAFARIYARRAYHTGSPGSCAGKDKTDTDRVAFEAHEYLFRIRRATGLASGALFEVGCSVGAFLEVARAAGYEVAGCDVSPWAASEARSRGLAVSTGDLAAAALPSESLDLMVMWEVIEHLYAPREEMREIFRVLRPSGWVVFFTLNQSSRTARLATRALRETGEDPFSWYRPEQHIQHFSVLTIRRLLGDAGFGPVKIEVESSAMGLERAAARLGLRGAATEWAKAAARRYLAAPKRVVASLLARAWGGELLYGYAQKTVESAAQRES